MSADAVGATARGATNTNKQMSRPENMNNLPRRTIPRGMEGSLHAFGTAVNDTFIRQSAREGRKCGRWSGLWPHRRDIVPLSASVALAAQTPRWETNTGRRTPGNEAPRATFRPAPARESARVGQPPETRTQSMRFAALVRVAIALSLAAALLLDSVATAFAQTFGPPALLSNSVPNSDLGHDGWAVVTTDGAGNWVA